MSNNQPPVIVNVIQPPSAPDPQPSGGHLDNSNIFVFLVLICTFGLVAMAAVGSK